MELLHCVPLGQGGWRVVNKLCTTWETRAQLGWGGGHIYLVKARVPWSSVWCGGDQVRGLPAAHDWQDLGRVWGRGKDPHLLTQWGCMACVQRIVLKWG